MLYGSAFQFSIGIPPNNTNPNPQHWSKIIGLVRLMAKGNLNRIEFVLFEIQAKILFSIKDPDHISKIDHNENFQNNVRY